MLKEKDIAYAKNKLPKKLSRLAADLVKQLISVFTLLVKKLLAQDTLPALITVLSGAIRQILDGSPVLPALLRALLTALPMAAAVVLGEARMPDEDESDPEQTDPQEYDAE